MWLPLVAVVTIPLLCQTAPLHYVPKETFLPRGGSLVHSATRKVTKTPLSLTHYLPYMGCGPPQLYKGSGMA